MSDTDDTPSGPLARARAVLASPWTGAVLVVTMVAALRLVAPWSRWTEILSEAQWSWLALGVAIVPLHTVVRAYRMERLLPELSRHRGPHTRLSFGMAAIGQLPIGTVGGDAFRIVKFTCLDVEAECATAATLIIRMAGFATSVLVAAVLGAVYLGSVLPLLALIVPVAILGALAAAGHSPVFVERVTIDPDADAPSDAGHSGGRLWGRILHTVKSVLSRTLVRAADLSYRRLAEIMGLSIALIAIKGLTLWACARAIDLDVGVIGAAFALTVGNLASSIPSPAGSVGLREGGIVGAFAVLGAAAAPATVAGVLLRLALVAGALLGWGVMRLVAQSPEDVMAAGKAA